jgi:uncharacterized protein (DUF4415 family)
VSSDEARRLRDDTDDVRLDAMTDDDIARAVADDPDTVPLDLDWTKARLVIPPGKEVVTLRLDIDVLGWFRAQGKGYQTRINQVLRVWYETELLKREWKREEEKNSPGDPKSSEEARGERARMMMANPVRRSALLIVPSVALSSNAVACEPKPLNDTDESFALATAKRMTRLGVADARDLRRRRPWRISLSIPRKREIWESGCPLSRA